MPFVYNPGVQDRRAEIFQRSNEAFGQALIGLLDNMGKARAQKEAKLEALTHDAKSAEGAFNADLTTAGEDPNATKDVLARWNVASPQEWKTLSAADKVARRDGVIGAEQVLSWAQQNKKRQIDEQGGALLPKVLAKAQELEQSQPTTYDALGTGGPNPKPSTSKLLLQAMGTALTPAEQKTFGQSEAGKSLLLQAMGSSERADVSAEREAAINTRANAAITEKGREADNRLAEQKAWHESKAKVDQAKLEYYKAKEAAGGKLSPKDELSYWKGVKKSLLDGDVFHKNDPDWQAQHVEADAHINALLQNKGSSTGANGGNGGGKSYKSPEDVKAAVQSGAVSKDVAKKILKEQFGFTD